MQERIVEAARQDLSKRINAGVDEISVVSVSREEWRDSSLGCPQPGGMYAQVITPGYRVILQARGSNYEYHTDSVGRMVLCQRP